MRFGFRAVAGLLARIIMAAAALVALAPANAADFGASSRFPANPASGNGRYAFDLEMRVSIESDRGSGDATIYVNSADGSMAVADPHLTLWAFGAPDIPGLQVHQLIIRRGEIMACGRHPDYGNGCMQMGGAGAGAFHMAVADARAFLASDRGIDEAAARADLGDTSGLQPISGQMRDGTLATFWVEPGQSTIATQEPFLGPGVGVLKDYRVNRNRTVRIASFGFAEVEEMPLQWMTMRLRDLRQSTHRLDSSAYPLVTAFSSAGVSEATDLSAWITAQGRQVAALQQQLDACPRGRSGSDCRAEYRAQIKALEDQIRARALGFGARHGLPTGD